jgi:hypothetical protein
MTAVASAGYMEIDVIRRDVGHGREVNAVWRAPGRMQAIGTSSGRIVRRHTAGAIRYSTSTLRTLFGTLNSAVRK